jgi:ectoine hydrolase
MRSQPFPPAEYADRIARTRARMAEAGYTHLLTGDQANICYLTGFDACSAYVPQAVLVPSTGTLALFCREVDASSASSTGNLTESEVYGYPEPYVQQRDRHPMDWVAATMRPWLDGSSVLAVETDSATYTVRSHHRLIAGLSGVDIVEIPSLVNWVRAIKSPAEIEIMRVSGRMTEHVFEVAREAIRPGVRQCDAVAAISAAQVAGLPDAGGTYPAIPPIVTAGANTAFPHVPWSDAPFERDQPVALELSGVHHRYHAPVARTLYLGEPPSRLIELAEIVGTGLDAALAVIRPGSACEDVAGAWGEVIARHGLTKAGRVGYPIGLGYAPDWGEQTMSLRAGDTTPLQAGMTWHVMIGMWLDGWGYSISETVLVTDDGAECLATMPRGLWVNQ